MQKQFPYSSRMLGLFAGLLLFCLMMSPSHAASPTLETALTSYEVGDYATAQTQFNEIYQDEAANSTTQRRALHWRGRSELEQGDYQTAIASFKAFLADSPVAELVRPTQFNLALAYHNSGQFSLAIPAYKASLRPDDPANLFIHERLGDLHLAQASYGQAKTAYQAGLSETAYYRYIARFREKIAQVELDAGNPLQAVDQYDAILAFAEVESYRAKLLRLTGDAYLEAGDAEAAYASYQQAIDSYPTHYESYIALLALVEAEVPIDPFQRGLVDYYAEAYLAGIAAFEDFITQADEDDRLASARWYVAKSHKAAGQPYAALDAFDRYIADHPEHENWGRAHLEVGQLWQWLDDPTTAKRLYREFAAQNAAHPLAGQALWRAGRLDLDGDQLDSALRELTALAEQYPNNEYADTALYWAGRAAYLLDDLDTAADRWARLSESYPLSELADFGSYWQAKSLQEAGDPEQAEQVLQALADRPLSYYALRARDALAGRQPGRVPIALPSSRQLAREQAETEAWLAEWAGASKANIDQPSAALQADAAFQRGQALLLLGLRDEALAEFEVVKDGWWDNPAEMYQLALYFQAQKMGRLSIICAARVGFLSPAGSADAAPNFLKRLYYPIYYPDLFFTEAEQNQIDPALAIALTRQESLFEFSAESHAGARGLMQVMPTTGDYIANNIGDGAFQRDDLWRPYLSIKYGTWYISQQLVLFDDQQFPALAAYNAGPGNVQQWITVSDDLDVFVESIPFWESRLYIRKVYTNLAAYRQLYGN